MSGQAGRRYLNSDSFREMVRGVKDPAAIDTKKLAVLMALPTEVKSIGGKDSRLIEFIITSDRVDREQDVLNPDGWDMEDYLKNPVVLWAHDHSSMPIGNARSLTKVGNKWKSICEFTPPELCNGMGYMVYQMYDQGFMHACSVGFQPIEYTYAEERRYGINYVKQSLLEYSCVPVPANPDALVSAKSMGINLGPMKQWAEQMLDESRTTGKELSDEARRRVEAMRAACAPSGRALILELGEMKMAGTTTTDKTPTSPVKAVERWACGRDNCMHDTEAQAKTCADLETAVASAVALAANSNLTEAQKTSLGAAFKALVPAPTTETKTSETDTTKEKDGEPELAIEFADGEEGSELPLTAEQLRSAIESGVNTALAKAMGRAD